jgi:hypothetical protein
MSLNSTYVPSLNQLNLIAPNNSTVRLGANTGVIQLNIIGDGYVSNDLSVGRFIESEVGSDVQIRTQGEGDAIVLAPFSGTVGGNISLVAGSSSAASTDGGELILTSGSASGTGDGGNVTITAGGGTVPGNIVLNTSGDVISNADTYVNGDFYIDGKLNVTGLIDPTGMVFDLQSTVPGGTPVSDKSTLWVRTSDKNLMLTDDEGNDIQVSGVGGGAVEVDGYSVFGNPSSETDDGQSIIVQPNEVLGRFQNGDLGSQSVLELNHRSTDENNAQTNGFNLRRIKKVYVGESATKLVEIISLAELQNYFEADGYGNIALKINFLAINPSGSGSTGGIYIITFSNKQVQLTNYLGTTTPVTVIDNFQFNDIDGLRVRINNGDSLDFMCVLDCSIYGLPE